MQNGIKMMMCSRNHNFMKTMNLRKEKNASSDLEGPNIVQNHIKKHEKQSKKTGEE